MKSATRAADADVEEVADSDRIHPRQFSKQPYDSKKSDSRNSGKPKSVVIIFKSLSDKIFPRESFSSSARKGARRKESTSAATPGYASRKGSASRIVGSAFERFSRARRSPSKAAFGALAHSSTNVAMRMPLYPTFGPAQLF